MGKNTWNKVVFYMFFFYFQQFSGKVSSLSLILIKDSILPENFKWNVVFWKILICLFFFITFASQMTQNRVFTLFSAFCVSSTTERWIKIKKYSNHDNRCKIWWGVEIWARNWGYHLKINRVIAKTWRITRDNQGKRLSLFSSPPIPTKTE